LKQDQDKEIWKKLPNPYADYEVSSLGRVKSHKFREPYFMSPWLDPKGYLNISLSHRNRVKKIRVHRLVLLCFVGESDLHVNHKNGIKTDNELTNLEYCTPSENNQHGYDAGLLAPKKGKKQSLLKKEDVIKIFKSKDSAVSLSRKYGVVPTTITNIKRGLTWCSVTERLTK